MIRTVRLRSEAVDPGASVTLTCLLAIGATALHLDVDPTSLVAFDLLRAERSAVGVHIDVRCRAAIPSVFSGVLIVRHDKHAADSCLSNPTIGAP